MMGAVTLILTDSTFVLNERDGMMCTAGTWQRFENESKIYLSSFNRFLKKDGVMYFTLNKEEIKIKDKRSLVYKNIVLRKMP